MGFYNATALVGHKSSHIEIVPHFLFRLLQIAFNEPVRKYRRFFNVRAFKHDDSNPSGFHRHVYIHMALCTLVQIDIFRIAAAAGDDYVGLFFDGESADFQQILAAFVECGLPIPGNYFIQFTVTGQHHIKQKVRINKIHTFHQVLMERIPFQLCGSDIRVTAVTVFFRQGQHMVAVDGLQSGHPRHNSLTSAAEPCHGVQCYRTGSYNFICPGNNFIYIDPVAPGGSTLIDQVFLITAVMLVYP